jgi:hypothetical protein
MKLSVAIHTLDLKGHNMKVGDLLWDGKQITAKALTKDGETMLRSVMIEPIKRPGEDLIDPKKEPENFMRNLWRMYRSPYLQALEAV